MQLNFFRYRSLLMFLLILAHACSSPYLPDPDPDPDPPPLPPVESVELPTIRINTLNGASINSRTTWTTMSRFELIDPNNPEFNVVSNNPRDEIRGRGNTTWNAPKRPYRFRFRENTSLLGLDAHRNWVLLANWFDGTVGLRTAFAFELGNRLNAPFTPTWNFVNLYLNDVYQGLYLLTEHRQISPTGVGAPGRVEVGEDGWLVEFDHRWRGEDDDPIFTIPWRWQGSHPWDRYGLVIKGTDYPIADLTGTDNRIVRDWNEFAYLLSRDNPTFPENGWRDLIDMEGIMNYFLVQIISNNVDFFVGHDGRGHPGSVFWHKNADGLISAGPLWDFDLSFGSFIAGTLNWNSSSFYQFNSRLQPFLAPNRRPYPTIDFFSRFFDDPVFRVAWKENWNHNRAAILAMGNFIDETAAQIRPHAVRNYGIWRVGQDHGNNVDFDMWTTRMRTYFNTRMDFLHTEYNRVNVLPTAHDFETVTEATVVPKTFTLVSYGPIIDPVVSLGHGGDNFTVSDFTHTPTGNGGYLTTFTVMPDATRPPGTVNTSMSVRGTNQGQFFTHPPVNVSFRVL